MICENDNVSKLLNYIRIKEKISRENSLYIYTGRTLLNQSQKMSKIYHEYHNREDKILYMTFSS